MPDLPLTYKPKSLRTEIKPSVRDVSYSVHPLSEGYPDRMKQGPFTELVDALDCVPCTIYETVLIRHNSDGTDDVLYVWNHANNTWYIQTSPDSFDPTYNKET